VSWTKHLRFIADLLRFYKRIEDAYIYANKTLLKLMLEEQQLIPHLRYALGIFQMSPF